METFNSENLTKWTYLVEGDLDLELGAVAELGEEVDEEALDQDFAKFLTGKLF